MVWCGISTLMPNKSVSSALKNKMSSGNPDEFRQRICCAHVLINSRYLFMHAHAQKTSQKVFGKNTHHPHSFLFVSCLVSQSQSLHPTAHATFQTETLARKGDNAIFRRMLTLGLPDSDCSTTKHGGNVQTTMFVSGNPLT
jgi:hypothetical protein